MSNIYNNIVIIQNPDYADYGVLNTFETVTTNISYHEEFGEGIQTLSTNSADPSGKDKGVLYVPDLNISDYCHNASKQYIPSNVTRQQNLPNSDENLVAIAPWFDPNCTQSYLASARLDPIRAFIFYLPNYEDDDPPSIRSSEWDLGDQGHWKYVNKFPIYAIAASRGHHMIGNLSLYSGNMTDVPNGHILADEFGPQNYARIRTVIHSASNSSFPTVWLFLLVVVGALVVSVMTTSFIMHALQRKRRASLRRRIADGEVNLEALGIKRLTVPKDLIDKMPLYLYARHNTSTTTLAIKNMDNSIIQAQQVPAVVHPDSFSTQALDINNISSVVQSSRCNSIACHEYIRYYQSICPICLEDFVSHQTVIRELYCGHIYHPECVDSFLNNNSSLCPMCKKSALPRGWCPEKITNSMVRRERQLRKLRSRVPDRDEDMTMHSVWTHKIKPWGDVLGRTVLRIPSQAAVQPQPIHMEEADVISSYHEPIVLRVSSNEAYSRQDIMQQRVQQLLAGPAIINETPLEDRMSLWRRTLRVIFPH